MQKYGFKIQEIQKGVCIPNLSQIQMCSTAESKIGSTLYSNKSSTLLRTTTIVGNANIKESTLALSWLSTFIKSQKVEVHYVQANPLGRQDPVIPCLPPSDLICSKILWLNIWKSRYNKFKTEHTKSQKNISAKMFLIFFLTDYIDYNLSSIYPKIYPTISNGNFGARMYTTIFPKFGWKTMKLKPCGEHGIGFLKKKIWFHYRLRS